MKFRNSHKPYNKSGNVVKGRYVPKMCKPNDNCIDRSPILESGYTLGQTWKGLRKAWLGYTVALNKNEEDKRRFYAGIIQKLQQELVNAEIVSPLSMADFPDLDLLAYNQENKYKKQLEEDFEYYIPLEQLEWENSMLSRSVP